MGWAAIIAAIISVLGPILVDWFKKLLDKWFKKAVTTLKAPEEYGTPQDTVGALFDAAIDGLPKAAYVRRTALRALKRVALRRAVGIVQIAKGMDDPDAADVPGLTEEETKELTDAVAGCK